MSTDQVGTSRIVTKAISAGCKEKSVPALPDVFCWAGWNNSVQAGSGGVEEQKGSFGGGCHSTWEAPPEGAFLGWTGCRGGMWFNPAL